MMKLRRRIGETVAVIVALAVLWAMLKTTPNYNRLLAPIEAHGAIGSEVRGRSLVARVDGIELARSLQRARGSGVVSLTTGGVFVIAHVTASATLRPARVAMAALIAADGTRYLQTDRVSVAPGLLGNLDLQPDVPAQGDLVFEVPASALADARLLLSAAPFGLAPLDSVLNVDLRIDQAHAAAMLAAVPVNYVLRER